MARRVERAEKTQQHLAEARASEERAAEERAAEEQRKKAVAATARAAQVQVPSIVSGASRTREKPQGQDEVEAKKKRP